MLQLSIPATFPSARKATKTNPANISTLTSAILSDLYLYPNAVGSLFRGDLHLLFFYCPLNKVNGQARWRESASSPYLSCQDCSQTWKVGRWGVGRRVQVVWVREETEKPQTERERVFPACVYKMSPCGVCGVLILWLWTLLNTEGWIFRWPQSVQKGRLVSVVMWESPRWGP